MKPSLIILICLMAAACTPFPEVDAAERADVKSAKFPKVVPMEQVLSPPATRLDENSEANLEGRITGLKHRAKKLQSVNPD